MDEHPNVAAVRAQIKALNEGDMESMRASIAPDIKWHMIGGQTIEGRDALEQMGAETMGEYSIHADVHDVVGNDEHVVALVEATATVGDQTFKYRTAEIMHVTDGVVTERWAFSDDTEAINRFFGQFQ